MLRVNKLLLLCCIASQHLTTKSMSAAQTTQIAVLYASKGGMGDVGKFGVALHASARPDVKVRAAALAWQDQEGKGTGFDAVYPDVTYPGGRLAIVSVLREQDGRDD